MVSFMALDELGEMSVQILAGKSYFILSANQLRSPSGRPISAREGAGAPNPSLPMLSGNVAANRPEKIQQRRAERAPREDGALLCSDSHQAKGTL